MAGQINWGAVIGAVVKDVVGVAAGVAQSRPGGGQVRIRQGMGRPAAAPSRPAPYTPPSPCRC